jgi:hypothetical protein
MTEKKENKTLGAENAAGASAPPVTAAPQKQNANDKSWGDKYKEKGYHFIRNFLLNYVVNFGISAAFTYKVEKSSWGRKLDSSIKQMADAGQEKLKVPSGLTEFVAKYFTISQLLMFGGHAIVPLMKYSHDHKKGMELVIGHRLDQLQEMSGNGNAASKRRLEEYKVVTDILKARPKELSERDKTLLVKNGIDENLHFNERPSTWGHILKARLGGVLATTSLGVSLGVATAIANKTNKDWLNFNKFAEEKAGKMIAENITKPVLGSHVENHGLLGKFIFIEMIYTLVSKLGFDRIEHIQRKKRHAQEQAAAAAALIKDEKALSQINGESPTQEPRASFAAQVGRGAPSETRRKIIEEGEKDFRGRESTKPGEAVIAMS